MSDFDVYQFYSHYHHCIQATMKIIKWHLSIYPSINSSDVYLFNAFFFFFLFF